jgi:hypothetical protein
MKPYGHRGAVVLIRTSGDILAGSAFEEFVDEGLIGLGLFGGHAAELGEKARGDADGNQVFGVTRNGAADAPCTAELLVGGLGNIGKVELAIGQILHVLCALPGAR